MAKVINWIKVISEELALRINTENQSYSNRSYGISSWVEGLANGMVDSFLYLGSTIETCDGLLADIWRKIVLKK